MDRVKRYLTYIVLATFPIMSIVDIGGVKFNLALSDILIIILGLIWLIDIRKFKLKIHYPQFWYFGAVLVVFLISNVYNLSSGVSSSGISGIASEGIKICINAAYLFVGYNSIKEQMDLKKMVKYWGVGLWVFMLYGIYLQINMFIGMEPIRFNNALSDGSRFLGTITDANAAAFYLSVSFFGILCALRYLMYDNKVKVFLTITGVICLICILLTMSRGGIIGFFVGLSIYVVYNIRYIIKRLYLLPVVLCIAMSILYMDTNFLRNQLSDNFINRSQDVTEQTGMFEIRWNLSKAAIDMGIDNPLIGVGRGNYALNSKDYLINNGAQWERDKWAYEYKVAHNTLAGMFAELGLIGLLMFVSIFVIILIKVLKSKDMDTGFKVILLSLWSSVLVQSLSISLENARVLWILAGINIILLDQNIILRKSVQERSYKTHIKTKLLVSIIGVVLSGLLYIDIAPKYIYGDIDVSNKNIELEYNALEAGEYTFRYYIYNQRKAEHTEAVSVKVMDKDNNILIKHIEYQNVDGYGNIYIPLEKETHLKFEFIGKEDTKIKDVKVIKPDATKVVLLNNYPLLTEKMEQIYAAQGKLIDIEAVKAEDKKYITDNIEVMNTIFGDKLRYKGVDIEHLEDGRAQLQFTFECLDKMTYDYIMWMHLVVDDINSAAGSSDINCDHGPSVPTSQWEVGQEYKDTYVIDLSRGDYKLDFGFWIPPEGNQLEKRLMTNNELAGVTVGWFKKD